jgi:hypothetical protein
MKICKRHRQFQSQACHFGAPVRKCRTLQNIPNLHTDESNRLFQTQLTLLHPARSHLLHIINQRSDGHPKLNNPEHANVICGVDAAHENNSIKY